MENSLHESQLRISSLESVTAPSKVFAIPDLLRIILVHLPAPDLLICQRINSTWRDIIRESSILQKKLFYKCDLADVDVDDLDPGDDLLRLETNPFIELLHRRQALARENDEVDAESLGTLDYPEASWKKMYLTRPALCTIETRPKIPDHFPNSPNSGPLIQISQSDGVRMHHLEEMDLSKLMLPSSRYCIRCIGALASNK